MPTPSTNNSPRLLPASHWESLRRIESGYWWYVARINWAASLVREWYQAVGSREPLLYSDLGCGTGGFATEIAERFPVEKVALVDADPRLGGSVHDETRFELLSRDLTGPLNLPFEPTLVTCMDVMEHLPDDKSFLDRVHSVLKPAGLLVMSVPALQALYSDWDRALGHYRRYSRGQLTSLIERAGFRVLRADYMWSFLTPLGAYRLVRSSKENYQAEFTPVPHWLNQALIALSGLEQKTSRLVRAPFGTSIMLSAIKK